MMQSLGQFSIDGGALFSSFVALAVKATLILVAAFAIDMLLGRRRALARSSLWHATLLALAILPVANWLLPAFSVVSPAQDHPPMIDAEMNMARLKVGAVANGATIHESLLDQSDQRGSVVGDGDKGTSIEWPALLLMSLATLYVMISAAVAIRLSMSLRGVAALTATAECVADERWNRLLTIWCSRLGVVRRIRLLVSPDVSVPVQIGWLRPSILLPPTVFASGDEATRVAVLVHELGHVRRGDYGWNLLLRAISIVYWPHPLVWLAARKINQVREQACDELCVHWLGGAAAYRATLIELASDLLLRRPVAALGIAMSQSTKLARRLEWIEASPGRACCLQSGMTRSLFTIVMLAAAAALCSAAMNDASAQVRAADDEVVKEKQPPASNAPVESARPTRAGSARNTQDVVSANNTPGVDPNNPTLRGAPSPEATSDTTTGDADDDLPKPVPVLVERVKRHDFTIETAQVCSLIAQRTSDVYARVPGYVKGMAVDIGDVVKNGDTLAELESGLLAPELDQAEALLAESEAEELQAKAGVVQAEADVAASQADVGTSQAEVEAATAKVQYHEKQVERFKNAANEGAVPARTIRDQEEKLVEAKAALIAAKSAVVSAQRSVGKQEAALVSANATLKLAAARVRVAHSRLAEVKKRSEYAQVTSPMDGVVISRQGNVGEHVGSRDKTAPLCTIADLSVITAVTQVPERDALSIKRGDAARIVLNAFPRKVFSTKVSRLAYNIDAQTGTLRVELDIANNDADVRMLPGMSGAAHIVLGVHRDVISVPLSALYARGEELAVYKVVDGLAVKTTIETGGRSNDRIEVVSGLKEGDVVITGLANPKRKKPDWSRQRVRVEIVEHDAKP